MKIAMLLTAWMTLSCHNGSGKDVQADPDKLPLTLRNFYQDNNYSDKPSALIDGDLKTPFVPAWNLIYQPNDVVVDISDYKATIKKIRIYDGQGDKFNTKLILVRKDNEQEVEVGTYTGDKYETWVEFTPPSSFEASRFIMRGGANGSYGNELELIGDYTPYKEPGYNRARKPLKDLLGVNAHWWDFLNNMNMKGTAIVPAKYDAFMDLGLTSLRNYGNAKEYQPVKDKWAFNPVHQGWYEEDLFAQIKKDRPDMVCWSVMQGQFDFVRNTWDVPDPNYQFTATVSEYINHNTWGVLVLQSASNKNTGGFRRWHIELASPVPKGKTAKDFATGSSNQMNIPTSHPSRIEMGVGGNLPYEPGMKVNVTKGQSSELNIYYADNNKRDDLSTWEVLGRMAYVMAARKGKNAKAPGYNVWSHVDYDPEHSKWIAPNEVVKGSGTADLFEGMNEPNAFWAGYDDYLNGRYLAPAWSMMYDGNKGQFKNFGVKNADPAFKMSTSGLATASTDIMRAVYWWSKKNRGIKKDGSVDLPFDIIQFHNYSYTGGVSQYAGGVQGGLPPELSNVLDAADEFVWYSNKYAAGREVWIGEWGYDVNPESPMNAPAYGKYTAEQTRANWAMRTILEYAAHGIDRAQWYRLYQDGNWADKDATQFSTMSLLRENEDKTISRRLVGDYFKQVGELGDYVFDSRVSESPRVLKYKKGKDVMYAIWGVEQMKKEKNSRPEFTETTGTYELSLPGISAVTKKEFQDGSGLMRSEKLNVNGKLSINYSAKPLFIVTNE
jgi:hypothetical protein